MHNQASLYLKQSKVFEYLFSSFNKIPTIDFPSKVCFHNTRIGCLNIRVLISCYESTDIYHLHHHEVEIEGIGSHFFGYEFLAMIAPRMIAITHPRAKESITSAIRFLALMCNRIVLDVFMFTTTSQYPSTLSHDIEKGLTIARFIPTSKYHGGGQSGP